MEEKLLARRDERILGKFEKKIIPSTRFFKIWRQNDRNRFKIHDFEVFSFIFRPKSFLLSKIFQKFRFRWEAQQKDWERIRNVASKKLDRKKNDLVITKAEEYREKIELFDLLGKATPDEVSSGGHSWLKKTFAWISFRHSRFHQNVALIKWN